MDVIELKLSDDEFDKIREIVYKTTGISLAESKRALIISRLYRRLKELEFESFEPYIRLLQNSPDETIGLTNRITTNLTRFYREENQFKVLRQTVLPQILQAKKKKKDPFLRIWSAGCSTGEEVYTILFEVLETFDGRVPSGMDFKILGSDIDTNVLEKAGSGQYSDEEIKGLAPGILEKYFSPISDTSYRIKENVRRFAGFRRINLVYDVFKFKRMIDIIFCRNVVIYFDKQTRSSVYMKFHQVLNSPGFFFSGHSENLFKYNHVFSFIEKSVYKKVEVVGA